MRMCQTPPPYVYTAGYPVDKEGKKESRYLRREFSYSKFQQTLILPDDVDKDKIDAKVNDGVLTIELPKRTPEDKEKAAKVIEVK